MKFNNKKFYTKELSTNSALTDKSSEVQNASIVTDWLGFLKFLLVLAVLSSWIVLCQVYAGPLKSYAIAGSWIIACLMLFKIANRNKNIKLN